MKTFDTVEQIAAEPDMHERYTYLANKYAVKLQWHEARGIFNEFYYTTLEKASSLIQEINKKINP